MSNNKAAAQNIPQKSAETELTKTLTNDSTWYDMVDGGTGIDTHTPAAFNSAWASNPRCKAVFKVDLSNMAASDAIDIEFLEKINSSGSFQRRAYYSYADAQTTDIVVFELEVSSYGVQARIRQTAGTGREVYVTSYAYQGQNGL